MASLVGPLSRLEGLDEAAVRPHEVEERRVVHHVVGVLRPFRMGAPVDAEGFERSRHRLLRAGEADQTGHERRDVGRELLHRVALRIDGDEEGLDAGPLRLQVLDHLRHGQHGGRADVGAPGEAEVDERVLAQKILVGARRAGVVDQRELALDLLRRQRHAGEVALVDGAEQRAVGLRVDEDRADDEDPEQRVVAPERVLRAARLLAAAAGLLTAAGRRTHAELAEFLPHERAMRGRGDCAASD